MKESQHCLYAGGVVKVLKILLTFSSSKIWAKIRTHRTK